MNWKKTLIWASVVLFASPFVIYIVPQLFGVDAYVVKSNSMEPTLGEGSILYVEPVESRNIQKGDVVVFRPEGSWTSEEQIAHRIVDERMNNTTRYFKTKGDNNFEADPNWINEENISGEKAYSIPFLGYIVNSAHTLTFVIVLVLIPSAILIKTEIEKLLEKRRTRLSEIL